VVSRLWICERGWHASDGTNGVWETDCWAETADLLAALGPRAKRRLVLAPDLYVYAGVPMRPGITPMEAAHEMLGLQPGHWVFQSEARDEYLHLICYRPELEAALEELAARWPDTLRIDFAPLVLPPRAGESHAIEMGDRVGWSSFDEAGRLEQWHWLPSEVTEAYARVPSSPDALLADETDAVWLSYTGDPVTQYDFLGRLTRGLARALVVLVLSSAAIWAGFTWQERTYARQAEEAHTFLSANRLEADEIERMVQSGELISRELREIQEFSNRDNPLANRVTVLANLGDEKTVWQELRFEEDRFSLVLAGERWQDILDMAARLRAEPGIRALEMQDLDTRTREGNLSARIEGVFP